MQAVLGVYLKLLLPLLVFDEFVHLCRAESLLGRSELIQALIRALFQPGFNNKVGRLIVLVCGARTGKVI